LTTVDLFVRHFLAIYFTLIGLHYSSRSFALSERTGFTHIHYGPPWSPTWWHRHVFNIFRAAILLVCVARLFWPIDPYLGPFQLFQQPVLQVAGVALLLISFCVIDYIHGYMHKDWRSGIEEHGDQQLIRTGPFSRSRNPMFIGVLLGQLGFFLALPSVFSLICLLVGATVIRRQVRSEESALRRKFGGEYEDYCQHVPRWF